LAKGAERFSMTTMGYSYAQGSFKYQLKCLSELRTRYAALSPADQSACSSVLTAPWLTLLQA
jgi:hypothetical protein